MNIIRSRLAKAIRVYHPTTLNVQKRHPDRLRQVSHIKGVVSLPIKLNFMVSEDQNKRLNQLADDLRIKRGVLLRDALDFYLGMARQETESGKLHEGDIITTTLAPDKIRRPDGAIVLLTEVDPGGKRPEIQAQKSQKGAKGL